MAARDTGSGLWTAGVAGAQLFLPRRKPALPREHFARQWDSGSSIEWGFGSGSARLGPRGPLVMGTGTGGRETGQDGGVHRPAQGPWRIKNWSWTRSSQGPRTRCSREVSAVGLTRRTVRRAERVRSAAEGGRRQGLTLAVPGEGCREEAWERGRKGQDLGRKERGFHQKDQVTPRACAQRWEGRRCDGRRPWGGHWAGRMGADLGFGRWHPAQLRQRRAAEGGARPAPRGPPGRRWGEGGGGPHPRPGSSGPAGRGGAGAAGAWAWGRGDWPQGGGGERPRGSCWGAHGVCSRDWPLGSSAGSGGRGAPTPVTGAAHVGGTAPR